jgi:hypothetical protein
MIEVLNLDGVRESSAKDAVLYCQPIAVAFEIGTLTAAINTAQGFCNIVA